MPRPNLTTAQYLGQFATRVCDCSNVLAAGTAVRIQSKTRHISRANVQGGVQVAFPNWYVSVSTFQESGNGGTATISGYLEYPIGSTLYQLTWSSASTVDVASGAQSPLCDAVNVAIRKGEAFMIRVYYANASGVLILQATGSQQDTANGEQFRYSATTLTDQTGILGAYTAGTASGALNYGPTRIVAPITEPSIYLIGDSRCQGYTGDTYANDSSTDKGSTARSVGPHFGYHNAGIYGDALVNFAASNAIRLANAEDCKIVLSEYGINDVTGGANTATLLARLQTVRALFPGKPFYQVTVSPVTSHSAGQKAARTGYNDGIRALPSWLTGYFDFADVAETSRNSGVWIGGSPNDYTNDEIHETQLMNQMYRDNFPSMQNQLNFGMIPSDGRIATRIGLGL